MWGSMYCHSSSDRSVGYLFLGVVGPPSDSGQFLPLFSIQVSLVRMATSSSELLASSPGAYVVVEDLRVVPLCTGTFMPLRWLAKYTRVSLSAILCRRIGQIKLQAMIFRTCAMLLEDM
jgi:hypothetical protein